MYNAEPSHLSELGANQSDDLSNEGVAFKRSTLDVAEDRVVGCRGPGRRGSRRLGG